MKKIDVVPNSLQFFYFGTFATLQTLYATSVQRYTFSTNLGHYQKICILNELIIKFTNFIKKIIN